MIRSKRRPDRAARDPRSARRAAVLRGLVVGAIVLVSVSVRVAYFVELRAGPCFRQHLWDRTDMSYFDAWAKRVMAGDWLSRTVHPPVHPWHRQIAQGYFARHPAEEAELERTPSPDGGPADPAVALWERWCGGGRFYQDPLYPYLVAITYRVFGADVGWVFLWQMTLGILSNLLIYVIARRHFGDAAAAAAGLLSAVCSPLLFYELVLLRETAIVFAALALVAVVDIERARGGGRGWLGTGLATGGAILLKAHFALFAVGVLGLLALDRGRRPRERARLVAAFLAGVALALAPLVARNLAVGAPPFGISSAGGLNFIVSNADDVDSKNGFFSLQHAARIMGMTEGRPLRSAVETLRALPSPGAYPRILGAKLAAAWHWYEIPNNECFYYYRLHAAVLRWMPATFLVLAPLSLVGLGLAWRRRREAAPLYLMVATSLAVLLLFLALSRYRAPLVATLMPFAGLTVASGARLMRLRRTGSVALLVVALTVVALWTARPLPPGQPLIRSVDFAAAYWAYYDPSDRAAREAGEWGRSAEILSNSLRFEPESIRRLGPGRSPADDTEAALARLFADVRARRAESLRRAGLASEAEAEERRAAAIRATLTDR